MIFAIPPLQRLQVSDRREEARRGLADRLEQFALVRGEKVLLVFDGNALPSNPDAARGPLFEIVYAPRGAGGADDRILNEARRCLERGHPVTVVTDDVNTLAGKLPRGVRHLGVRAFWLKQIEQDAGESGKRVEGDFSDMEREMMARAARTEPVQPATGPAGPSHPGVRARAGEEAMRERILGKRERGRLRQERRLKRRAPHRRPR